MKKIITLSLIIAGCSASHNDKMNTMLSDKKMYEDSLNIYTGRSMHFESLYKNENDTTKKKLYLDTTIVFDLNKFITEKRLKTINYSIDSLSKLK